MIRCSAPWGTDTWKVVPFPVSLATVNPGVPIIKPDGTHKKGPDGKDVRMAVPDSDSGIYLRGTLKAQVNIWGWPVGSGEVYGYRTDEGASPAIRAGVTPRTNADRDIGQWNTF